jgi:ferrous iron transport protein A
MGLLKMSLNQVPSGHAAVIREINADEHLLQRMIALGLRRGRRVLVLRRANYHGPLHVRVGMTEMMIRRRDADTVEVALDA